MGRTTTAIAALALAAATPALAEPSAFADAQPGGSEDVVVKGERLTGKKLHDEAADFVKRIGVATGRKAAARWAEAVCPAAYGIVESQGALVVAQLRRVAAAAGIETAPEGCKPNLAIVFAADGGTAARDMAKRQPARFEEVTPTARDRLFKGNAPIRWWYSTQELGKDGRDGISEAPVGVTVCANMGISAIGGNGRTKFLSRYNTGMISTEVIRAIHSATVVIDVNRTAGQTLETVTAYAALVSLAEISPQDPPPNRSILGLFNPDPGPNRDLTEWDMTFLKALYRLPLDRDARMHRGLLTQELVKGRTGG